MATLSERLRTISAMIHLGEKISWGSETELMDEAADTLDAIEAALEQGATQMRIWISCNGDMVGELSEKVAAMDAALAMVRK